ncbi:MAG: hypothetical protein KKC76_13625 [Proteobacteria bacterium]|nr:hypothetical protein [Pseudomonadota bacterium]MBU4296624.1 hypothetical protein [Pseudomonadota bacterium]MCG2748253.1 hypothetical protein [Desulfobulbaceae bacterium]
MKVEIKAGTCRDTAQCFFVLFFFCSVLIPFPAAAGPYTLSIHGSGSNGVHRSSITGYSVGNCSHCHEQHASIDGEEPSPMAGSASAFTLFSDNFNDTAQTGPYAMEDNFCFYCHIATGGVQSGGGITNYQFCITFGGYTVNSATDVMGAFNLSSYHNLYDIQTFAESKFTFFKPTSNPCVACHNPHLVKNHKDNPTDSAYTTISRPTDHGELWGDDANERMSNYTSYRPPYYYGSTTSYEPGGVALHDGSQTTDYNAFCLDCHQYEVPVSTSGLNSMNPTTTSGHLTAIDWSSAGDMHGERPRLFDVGGGASSCTGTIIAPYNAAPVKSNYVLSCLDCHDPHGSVLASGGRTSTYLMRKEINNNKVDGCGPGVQNFCESEFCYSCHTNSHAGAQGCFTCHYHGGKNINCSGPWTGPNF